MPMKTPKLPPNMRSLGIAWFREEDWPRWCAIDPDFQRSYQHWLGRAEAALASYKAAGVKVEKITMDPDQFLEWSRAEGAGVGTEARAAYVSIKTMRRDTDH